MFTGLIETRGKVVQIHWSSESASLTIDIPKIIDEIKIGDSIATNGVCLTVKEKTHTAFKADVMPVTMLHTNLGLLKVGSLVNVERAMKLSDRLDGHMVTGHVDAIGNLLSIRQVDHATIYRFTCESNILSGMIDRGSVAIDGISLTIQRIDNEGFEVSIIPHTSQETILPRLQVGDKVNIETDVIGKYVARLLGEKSKSKSVDMALLLENGFL